MGVSATTRLSRSRSISAPAASRRRHPTPRDRSGRCLARSASARGASAASVSKPPALGGLRPRCLDLRLELAGLTGTDRVLDGCVRDDPAQQIALYFGTRSFAPSTSDPA